MAPGVPAISSAPSHSPRHNAPSASARIVAPLEAERVDGAERAGVVGRPRLLQVLLQLVGEKLAGVGVPVPEAPAEAAAVLHERNYSAILTTGT